MRRRTSTLAIPTAKGSFGSFGARIAGVGHYTPERVVTNADFEKMLDTSDEWITTRTGMKERRYAPADMPSSDMCVFAARHALERTNLKATDIDCFIVATVTPDFQFPATACILARKLDAIGKAAFDIEIACSGFIYALPIAASFVRTGVFRRVMIVGVEKLSAVVNLEDRGTAVLFGDGAGCAIVERVALADDSFLSCELGADGSNPEALYIPAGGTAEPISVEGLRKKRHLVQMQGNEIFRYAVSKMAESSLIAMEKANLSKDEITWVIPHQANKRIIDATIKRLKIDPERVIVNIEKYGNTSSASIPIALSETFERKLLKAGDIILFTGFGGGLSWGSVAWRWAA